MISEYQVISDWLSFVSILYSCEEDAADPCDHVMSNRLVTSGTEIFEVKYI